MQLYINKHAYVYIYFQQLYLRCDRKMFSLNTSKKYPRFLIHFILQILQISMLLISSKLKHVAKYPHICTPITECSFQSVRHCVIRGIVMIFWFSSLCIRTYNHGVPYFYHAYDAGMHSLTFQALIANC